MCEGVTSWHWAHLLSFGARQRFAPLLMRDFIKDVRLFGTAIMENELIEI